jgi:hypothetical protein
MLMGFARCAGSTHPTDHDQNRRHHFAALHGDSSRMTTHHGIPEP